MVTAVKWLVKGELTIVVIHCGSIILTIIMDIMGSVNTWLMSG